MEFHVDPESSVRVADQHPDVFPGSPLAVLGVFIETLRTRFSGDNAEGSPYYWAPDMTPDPDAAPDAPQRLYIESEYVEDADARDFCPALYVSKGETRALKHWLGNTADTHEPTQKKFRVCHATIPVKVECVAHRRGESAVLADTVFSFFLCSRNEIRAAFGIHDLSPPVVSNTLPDRRQSGKIETWVTYVGFEIQIAYVWTETPIAPRLAEIAARWRAAGSFDAAALDLLVRG